MIKKLQTLIVSTLLTGSLFFAVSALLPAKTFALFENSKCQAIAGANLDGSSCDNNNAPTQVSDTLKNAINLLSIVVGIISIIMIIVGGLRFVTSQGNAQSATNARNSIIYAVIGLVIAIMAQAIVHFVIGKFSK